MKKEKIIVEESGNLATDKQQTTFDNSPMGEKGKIAYGYIDERICIDGVISKTNTKQRLRAFIEEFLKERSDEK
jgi:hypothetical protein